jgi:hypothetical protein
MSRRRQFAVGNGLETRGEQCGTHAITVAAVAVRRSHHSVRRSYRTLLRELAKPAPSGVVNGFAAARQAERNYYHNLQRVVCSSIWSPAMGSGSAGRQQLSS